MEKEYFAIVTELGAKKMLQAVNEGIKVNVTEFAVGDGSGETYKPVPEMEGLKNEVWRGTVNACYINEEAENLLVIETVLPSDVGGFTIREMGIFDTDGTMIAVCNTPDTQKVKVSDGVLHELHLSMEIALSNAEIVELVVDPTVVMATKKDIENLKGEIENANALISEKVQEVLNSEKISIGANATAAGNNATAVGHNAAANTGSSTALGYCANAEGVGSTALGHETEANFCSTALGGKAMAVDYNSTAVGYCAAATLCCSTAIGYCATAFGENSTAVGNNATSNGKSGTTVGNCAQANGNFSIAVGSNANAKAYGDIALGSSATAGGSGSVAIGPNANARNYDSTALGGYAAANNSSSVALGRAAKVDGDNSVALGAYAVTSNANSIQLGNASSLSSLTARVSITVTSDERDKADITEMDSKALDFLKKVKAIRYVFNSRELYIDEEHLSEEERRNKEKYGLCSYDREEHAKGTK